LKHAVYSEFSFSEILLKKLFSSGVGSPLPGVPGVDPNPNYISLSLTWSLRSVSYPSLREISIFIDSEFSFSNTLLANTFSCLFLPAIYF
jgi:hypothetical protein